MNHALAAVISVAVNLVWFIAFAWCLWRMGTGFFRVRQRMRALPDYQGPSFFWTWQTLAFAFREKPRQPDSQRLVTGWLGAIGLCLFLMLASIAFIALLPPHAPR
jgi:hypothetical protein